jgi:ArsR family transcriptional regulator, arsenate/arsenite/antimonite-responsive transcriptional repressor
VGERHGLIMNHRAVDVLVAALVYITSMTVDLKVVDLNLAPKKKRAAGEPCCDPLVLPEIDPAQAARLATVARALSDPIRLQLVDVLRRHAGKVCVCELTPLFEVSQPTVSHHLKVLREAGLIDVERRGLWSFYYVIPEAMKEFKSWLK